MPPVEEAVEVPTAATEVAEDGTSDQDLLDGWNGTAEPITPEPAKTGDETDKPKEAAAPAPATDETTELTEQPKANDKPADEPEFVQITAAQLAEMQTALKELPGIKDALHRGVSGMGSKVGTIEAALRKMQESAPAGKKIVVSKEHFKELAKDFPDIVDMTVAGFNRALETVNTGEAATPIDIDAKVSERLTAEIPKIIATVEQTTSMEVMDGIRPGWLEECQGQPYREWLAKQPPEYQALINNSNKVSEVWGSLKSFDESKKPKPKVTTTTPANPRPSRLAAAVTPRSAASVVGGRRQSTGNAEEDAMQESFRSPR